MMKETQRQNRMRCSALMPHENGEQNDSGGDECGLRRPDVSLTKIDKRPHQATTAGAGEKGTGKIELSYALPDALAHSGDYEESRHNSNRHVDQESPAP